VEELEEELEEELQRATRDEEEEAVDDSDGELPLPQPPKRAVLQIFSSKVRRAEARERRRLAKEAECKEKESRRLAKQQMRVEREVREQMEKEARARERARMAEERQREQEAKREEARQARAAQLKRKQEDMEAEAARREAEREKKQARTDQCSCELIEGSQGLQLKLHVTKASLLPPIRIRKEIVEQANFEMSLSNVSLTLRGVYRVRRVSLRLRGVSEDGVTLCDLFGEEE